MNITNKAKEFLQEVMAEHGVEQVRVFFAGMG
ncbi:hypothetical protein J2S74_001673 [Evansella vedderi]|uniref:Uncharacterized protein n=1 Tax=Evansella vedderi TaxID=38282 RepID=A0ABT9ZST9_9BACI|nr:hypothetical protein [Evansella vedderi]